jgi:hypothetical protein
VFGNDAKLEWYQAPASCYSYTQATYSFNTALSAVIAVTPTTAHTHTCPTAIMRCTVLSTVKTYEEEVLRHDYTNMC